MGVAYVLGAVAPARDNVETSDVAIGIGLRTFSARALTGLCRYESDLVRMSVGAPVDAGERPA